MSIDKFDAVALREAALSLERELDDFEYKGIFSSMRVKDTLPNRQKLADAYKSISQFLFDLAEEADPQEGS